MYNFPNDDAEPEKERNKAMSKLEPAAKYGAQVRDLLAKAGAYAPPVDVERVAAHLGLEVREKPLKDEYSGFLDVKEKAIVVNSAQPPVRQRFTIAHEIGHHQLHRPETDAPCFVDHTVYFRSAQFNAAERERERDANIFAAELLMPEGLLAEHLDAHPLKASKYALALRELSEKFDVSKQAIIFRLRDLGFVILTSI